MRSMKMSMDTTVIRGEGDTETEIEVEVSGTVVPFWPGNFNNPPEGGYTEDVEALFQDGKKYREIQLTDDEVTAFSEQLAEQELDDEPDYDEDYEDDRDFDD